MQEDTIVDVTIARKNLVDNIIRHEGLISREREKIESFGSEQRQADDLDASQSNSDMHISTFLIAMYRQTITMCREAIKRIDNDTFGDCISCYNTIEFIRQTRSPHLPHCASCADIEERRAKRQ